MLSLLTVLLVASLLFTATVTAKKAMDMDAYNKRTGAKYLTEIAKKESVVTLKSGMLIEVLTPSSARSAVSHSSLSGADRRGKWQSRIEEETAADRRGEWSSR